MNAIRKKKCFSFSKAKNETIFVQLAKQRSASNRDYIDLDKYFQKKNKRNLYISNFSKNQSEMNIKNKNRS